MIDYNDWSNKLINQLAIFVILLSMSPTYKIKRIHKIFDLVKNISGFIERKNGDE